MKELSNIKENVDSIFSGLEKGEVRTVGDLKKEIANLPDEMKLTSSAGPEIRVYVFKEELVISVG